ncbi:10717_t:CDS:1, partial [Scutellospora calospora]
NFSEVTKLPNLKVLGLVLGFSSVNDVFINRYFIIVDKVDIPVYSKTLICSHNC